MSPYVASLRAAVGSSLLVLPAVTGIIRDRDNRILLVHQRDTDSWSTPGGSIDLHESPADAVVREVWEETGFEVEPVRIVGVFAGPDTFTVYPNGDQVSYINTVFDCDVRGGALRRESDETTDVAFIGVEDMERHRMTTWARGLLPRLFKPATQAYFEPPSWRRR
jgi:8-oxo-dGTP pyrophosphatase MutT (NUDIX family)